MSSRLIFAVRQPCERNGPRSPQLTGQSENEDTTTLDLIWIWPQGAIWCHNTPHRATLAVKFINHFTPFFGFKSPLSRFTFFRSRGVSPLSILSKEPELPVFLPHPSRHFKVDGYVQAEPSHHRHPNVFPSARWEAADPGTQISHCNGAKPLRFEHRHHAEPFVGVQHHFPWKVPDLC